MKLLWLTLFSVLHFSVLNAQTTDKPITVDHVPITVLNTFNAKFPAAQSTAWSVTTAYVYKALFYVNDKPMGASFDKAGRFTGYMNFTKRESVDSVFRRQLNIMVR